MIALINLANPKSAIFSLLLLNIMFAGLISLWITVNLFDALRPLFTETLSNSTKQSTIYFKIEIASFSYRVPFYLKRDSSVPPLQ